jgi:hypothetical protein
MKYDFFLSGPITGVEDFRERFADAEAAVMDRFPGARVWNPARLEAGKSYRWYMIRCLVALFRSEQVLMLPDWQFSPGAVAERAVAACLKMEIGEVWSSRQ